MDKTSAESLAETLAKLGIPALPVELLSGTVAQAVAMQSQQMVALPKVAKYTTLSVDTLERRYPHLIVALSPRRRAMSVGNMVAIAMGKANRS
jgi:hypothetical protein